jgi:hypothetical protein
MKDISFQYMHFDNSMNEEWKLLSYIPVQVSVAHDLLFIYEVRLANRLHPNFLVV